MRKIKSFVIFAVLIALTVTGACVPIAPPPASSPTSTPSEMPSETPTPTPTVSAPIILVPSDDVFRPDGQSHLYELLNFADPDSIKLFSLGENSFKGPSWEQGYATTFDGQYQLVEDPIAQDGWAVEIKISAPFTARPYRDLVLIDVSSAGLFLEEIGEIYIDYMFVDGEQLNNWWPRITLNENITGGFDANAVQSWRADGMVEYASARGDNSYATITQAEIASKYGACLQGTDMLRYIGFQFYVSAGQYATFRIDSITIKTIYEL